MATELSKLLYEKYFKLTNPAITVTLNNGKKITGVFISFFVGDEVSGEPYITKWHIVSEADKDTFGIDPFGFLIGEYIKQNDIAEIRFHQDKSKMKFNHEKG